MNQMQLNLNKVLYVPNLSKDLLSIAAMTQMGAEVLFDERKCIISKNERKVTTGHLVDSKLYMVTQMERLTSPRVFWSFELLLYWSVDKRQACWRHELFKWRSEQRVWRMRTRENAQNPFFQEKWKGNTPAPPTCTQWPLWPNECWFCWWKQVCPYVYWWLHQICHSIFHQEQVWSVIKVRGICDNDGKRGLHISSPTRTHQTRMAFQKDWIAQ